MRTRYFWPLLTFILLGCNPIEKQETSSPTPTTQPDTTPPVVVLSGEQEITIEQYSTYQELGASAYDAVDGTLKVTLIGTVDTSIPDTYTLTYRATDTSGNVGEAIRYVIVQTAQNTMTNIDVLALYSLQATNSSPDINTYIEHLFEVTNAISERSEVGVHITLSSAELYTALSDTENSDMVLETIQQDSAVAQMRDTLHADEVFIYRPYLGDGVCGVAYVNSPLRITFAVAHISIDPCPTDITAHEFGHNLGLAHSHFQHDPFSGIYPYAYGHVIPNLFGTVMTYAEEFNATLEAVYSNPDLLCQGQPCGVPEGEANAADASRTIRETKNSVAAFN